MVKKMDVYLRCEFNQVSKTSEVACGPPEPFLMAESSGRLAAGFLGLLAIAYDGGSDD